MSINTKKNLQKIIDQGQIEQISDVLSYQQRKNRVSVEQQNRFSNDFNSSVDTNRDRFSTDNNSNRQSVDINRNRPSIENNRNRPSADINRNRPSIENNCNRPSADINRNRPSTDNNRLTLDIQSNWDSIGSNSNKPSVNRISQDQKKSNLINTGNTSDISNISRDLHTTTQQQSKKNFPTNPVLTSSKSIKDVQFDNPESSVNINKSSDFNVDDEQDETYDQFNNDFDIDYHQQHIQQLDEIIHEYELANYDQQLDNQLFIKGSSRHSNKNKQQYFNSNQQQQQQNKNISNLIAINNQNKALTQIKNNQLLNLLQFEKIYMYLIGTSQSFSFYNLFSYDQQSVNSFSDDSDQFFDDINNHNKDQIINQQYFDLQSRMQFTLNKQQFQNKNASIKDSQGAIPAYNNLSQLNTDLQKNTQLSQQQKKLPTFSPFLQTQIEEPENYRDSDSSHKNKSSNNSSQKSRSFESYRPRSRTPRVFLPSKVQKAEDEYGYEKNMLFSRIPRSLESCPKDQQSRNSNDINFFIQPPPTTSPPSRLFQFKKFRTPWIKKHPEGVLRDRKSPLSALPTFKKIRNDRSSIEQFINYLDQINISTFSQWKLLLNTHFFGIPLIFQTLWPGLITSIFFLNFIAALVKLGNTQISISLTSSSSLSFNLVISLIILFGRQLIYQYFLFVKNSQDKLISIFFQLKKEQLYFYKPQHYSFFFKDYTVLAIYGIFVGGINISRFCAIWYSPRLAEYTLTVQKYSIYSHRVAISDNVQKFFYVFASCFESLRQVSIIRMVCFHILNMDHVIENYKQVLAKDFVTTIKCNLEYPLIRTMQNKEIFYKILRYQKKIQDLINPIVTTIFLSSFVLILLTIYQLTFFTRTDNGNSPLSSMVGGLSQLILTIYYLFNLITLFTVGNKCNQNIDYIIEQILNPNNFIINQDNLSTKTDILIMSQQLKSAEFGFQVQGTKISIGYLIGYIIGIIAYALTLITINL